MVKRLPKKKRALTAIDAVGATEAKDEAEMTLSIDARNERNRANEDFYQRLGYRPGTQISASQRNPLKAIRRFCVWCMGGSANAVEECTTSTCHLFKYRFGINPDRVAAGSAKPPPAKTGDGN